jgi:hypothetical protein
MNTSPRDASQLYSLKEGTMRTRHRIMIGLVLISALLVLAPSASSASSGTTTDEIVRGTVKWTLTPDQCPDIHTRIKGTGERLQVITTTVRSDGSKEIINNDFVTGTAEDSRDHDYYFIYSNQNRQLVPPSGSPVKVYMTDTFILSGNHGVNNLNVDFVWRWTFSPPAEQDWPPVHNWKKIFTLGDPLHCDPL